MTTSSVKPVTRETSAYVRERGLRAVMVTVHNGLIMLRPKGLRSTETVDIGALYFQAVKARVVREKAERKAARRRK